MKYNPDLVNYIVVDVKKIIEAVVTNNVGYGLPRKRPSVENSNCKLELPDGILISDQEHKDMHYHLGELENAQVLPDWLRRTKRLPLCLELILMKFSSPWTTKCFSCLRSIHSSSTENIYKSIGLNYY